MKKLTLMLCLAVALTTACKKQEEVAAPAPATEQSAAPAPAVEQAATEQAAPVVEQNVAPATEQSAAPASEQK